MRTPHDLARSRRELTLATQIPYTGQVAEHVVRTRAGHYVQVLQLGGVSFECADDADINAWHERLNVLLRNIASSQVSLWTHLVRRRDFTYPPGSFANGFASTLNERYRCRIAGERLMRNDWYLSLVYRPTSGAATGFAAKLLMRAQREESRAELAEALEACEKLRQTVIASLDRYEPEALGIYRRGGHCYSRVLEFLTLLMDGEPQPVPLTATPLYHTLGFARPSFGMETLEYRTATHTTSAAMIGIKEYATPTTPGLFNAVLSAPFPLVLTQSFSFLTKAAAQGLLLRQHNRLLNSGDFALSQVEDLRDALDALTSGEFVMGDHHLSLQVLSDPTEDPREEATEWRLKTLNDRVALARDLLTDAHVTVAREDLALEAAYWAQLPGYFSRRPRKAPLTSRNFAAMAAFHNHPSGRATGYHWGEATTVFISSAGSLYHYGLHASDPDDPEGGSRKDIGHTLICGPTGSGKTVLVGFLIAMLTKQGATQVILDKDHGLEILVRALGGDYLALRNGQPTGFNPLQLPVTAHHTQFLKSWVRGLAMPAGARALSVREQADLDQALHGTLALEPGERRLSRLIEYLDSTDPEGVFARLSPWCAAAGGDLAWVFDNPVDSMVPRLGERPLIGIDGTDFLNHDVVRPAISFYLFHLVRALLDGRRLVLWADEFSRWLGDPAFADFAKDGLKTWRKLEGVLCAATQSPSDALASPIARTIVEQTPTKLLFPNVDATPEDYIEGFGLTEREYRLIKQELSPGSRMFLIKRGRHSAVCQLDLKGFDAELAVISGRATNVALLNRLIVERGEAPEAWLPAFCAHFTRGSSTPSAEPASTGSLTRTSDPSRRKSDAFNVA
jgi:type IV secretion system protein VirB4